MIENKSCGTLCCIVENIADFEFKTPEAQKLKQQMRQWYYGGRDGAEANRLMQKFKSLFSGNMILDAVGDVLWTLAEQSPLEMEAPLRMTLSEIPRGQITGRSIRAYGITAKGIQYQFVTWQNEAASHITAALDKIEEQLKRERAWCKANRMSLPSALVALAGIAALIWGLLFLFPIGAELVRSRNFYETIFRLPAARYFSRETTQVCLGVFFASTVILAWHLRRMVMTLCAGLFWTFYQRGRFQLRSRLLAQFRRAMQTESVNGYCERLRAASQQLAELPPDAPQNKDPSRALLKGGPAKVFQKFPVHPISRCLNVRKFFQKVENCHVRSRKWIIILCATVVILRQFLLQTGLTAAFVYGLF